MIHLSVDLLERQFGRRGARWPFSQKNEPRKIQIVARKDCVENS